MSTGAVLNHGVSGFACTGRAGDFQRQRRGEPWENIVNDPIVSYLNAQSHIGIPFNNFNEPWTGGELRDANFGAQPYRKPGFAEDFPPPIPPNEKQAIPVASVQYPSLIGEPFAQQLPYANVHAAVPMRETPRQNLGFMQGSVNGDNKVLMPSVGPVLDPNKKFFQGANTATGVHPNNDKAGQSTAPNTTRADFFQGQAPYQKLPNGQAVGTLQPGEPPGLWAMAPAPEPQVLPEEGTGPLAPTVPGWW